MPPADASAISNTIRDGTLGEKSKSLFERVGDLRVAPDIQTTDGDFEPKLTAPLRPHFCHLACAARRKLIRTIDVSGNLQHVRQRFGNIVCERPRNVCNVQVHPPRGTGRRVDVNVQGIRPAAPKKGRRKRHSAQA